MHFRAHSFSMQGVADLCEDLLRNRLSCQVDVEKVVPLTQRFSQSSNTLQALFLLLVPVWLKSWSHQAKMQLNGREIQLQVTISQILNLHNQPAFQSITINQQVFEEPFK